MNKFIEKELTKIKVADIEGYKHNPYNFVIPKTKLHRFEENSYYVIQLHESLLHPSECSTLETNWNKGSIPSHHYYKVEVSKVMGKMIYITGIGYRPETDEDINEVWSGWLPINKLKIERKL